jgi:hypothetical protein
MPCVLGIDTTASTLGEILSSGGEKHTVNAKPSHCISGGKGSEDKSGQRERKC